MKNKKALIEIIKGRVEDKQRWFECHYYTFDPKNYQSTVNFDEAQKRLNEQIAILKEQKEENERDRKYLLNEIEKEKKLLNDLLNAD